MKRRMLWLLLWGICAHANDGAYYVSGNQLIPITETDISVKKEVLSVKRIAKGFLQVRVSYIFNNPAEAKELLVGFEAPSPVGDVDGTPRNGAHPYLNDFSVVINGINKDFKTAIVSDSNYYQQGQIVGQTEKEAMGEYFNPNNASFYYVYYFNAPFKKGLNTIEHTYNFKLSGSVMEAYSFAYILTAANRWANNGIDDFTLIIDLGDFQDFLIDKSFFSTYDNWELDGKMMDLDNHKYPYLEYFSNTAQVYCNGGEIVYKEMNFHPKGELVISAVHNLSVQSIEEFNPAKDPLPFDIKSGLHLLSYSDENAYKILRNLPYARRGFVFKTAFIQNYYAAQSWYQPRPDYESKIDDLTAEEKAWLDKLNAGR